MFNVVPQKDSAISLRNSSFEKKFNGIHETGSHDRYVEGDYKRLTTFGPITSVSKYKLTSSKEKETKEFDDAQLTLLIYNLLSSGKESDILSTVFHRFMTTGTRKEKLPLEKNNSRISSSFTYSKFFFGFAEHQKQLHMEQDKNHSCKELASLMFWAINSELMMLLNSYSSNSCNRRYQLVCTTLYTKCVSRKFIGRV